MRSKNDLARKSLWSLCPPQLVTSNRARDAAAVNDLFQRVHDRKRGGRRAAGSRLGDDALDRLLPDEGSRGVVHEDDLRFVWEILEPMED